jgi:hypothetical protein
MNHGGSNQNGLAKKSLGSGRSFDSNLNHRGGSGAALNKAGFLLDILHAR